MTIVTGYLTTQDGTTAPTDIGSIFSTGGSTTTSYLLGTLIYDVDGFFARPDSSIVDLSNNTIQFLEIIQIPPAFTLVVPQTGLYLITANLNPTSGSITGGVTYYFNAIIPDLYQTYNIFYCSTTQVSGSVIIPVTSANTYKTIKLQCATNMVGPTGVTASITFQISYISSL